MLANNPRKWPALFDFRAALVDPPQLNETMPPVRITLPDGRLLTSEQSDLNETLSKVFGREVRCSAAATQAPSLEEYSPDMEGLNHRESVTEEAMPADTFFDCATIHVLTTGTIGSSIRRGVSRSGGFVRTSWWNRPPAPRVLSRMNGLATHWPSGRRCALASSAPVPVVS